MGIMQLGLASGTRHGQQQRRCDPPPTVSSD